jgi:hypothetical protein
VQTLGYLHGTASIALPPGRIVRLRLLAFARLI